MSLWQQSDNDNPGDRNQLPPWKPVQQPPLKRIQVRRDWEKLSIVMPPAFGFATISLLGLSVIGLGIVGSLAGLLTYGLVLSLLTSETNDLSLKLTIALAFLLLALPCYLFCLGLVWNAVFAIAGTKSVQFDKQSFCLRWKCLRFSGKKVGNTADLEKAEVKVTVGPRRHRSTALLLWEGSKSHSLFEYNLSEREQIWLAQEINDWLRELRQHQTWSS